MKDIGKFENKNNVLINVLVVEEEDIKFAEILIIGAKRKLT